MAGPISFLYDTYIEVGADSKPNTYCKTEMTIRTKLRRFIYLYALEVECERDMSRAERHRESDEIREKWTQRARGGPGHNSLWSDSPALYTRMCAVWTHFATSPNPFDFELLHLNRRASKNGPI